MKLANNPESDWAAVYSAARYVVFAGGKKVSFQVAKPNKDLEKLLANQSVRQWAFITAHNPRSKRLSAEVNQKAQEKLIAEVMATGWSYFCGLAEDVVGSSWPSEDSLFVWNISESEALDLAVRYQQNAIVVGVDDGSCRLSWAFKPEGEEK